MSRSVCISAVVIGAILWATPLVADLPPYDWGETYQNVVDTGPGEIILSGDRRIVRHAELVGVPVTINYRFRDDELWQVRYLNRALYEDPGRYLDDYDHLKAHLIEHFGEPDETDAVWTNEDLRDRPEYHGQAVQVGFLTLVSGWQASQARVFMTLDNESFRPVQQLVLTDPAVPLEDM